MSIRMVGPIVTPDVRKFSIQNGRLINEWGVDCGSADDLANMKGKIEIIDRPAPLGARTEARS